MTDMLAPVDSFFLILTSFLQGLLQFELFVELLHLLAERSASALQHTMDNPKHDSHTQAHAGCFQADAQKHKRVDSIAASGAGDQGADRPQQAEQHGRLRDRAKNVLANACFVGQDL